MLARNAALCLDIWHGITGHMSAFRPPPDCRFGVAQAAVCMQTDLDDARMQALVQEHNQAGHDTDQYSPINAGCGEQRHENVVPMVSASLGSTRHRRINRIG